MAPNPSTARREASLNHSTQSLFVHGKVHTRSVRCPPLLPAGTVDTHPPENQIFEHTFNCLTNKIIGTYKVIQLNHTADLPGAITIWHKKNVTLVVDNGKEDKKSYSLDHTLFFLPLDLRVTFAIQAMPWSLK